MEKNKVMILCSISTLIFVSGGKGGCRACHMHLCQLRSPRGGRLDGFYFCLSFRRVYFWARKSQEKLDTQIRASPVVTDRPHRRTTGLVDLTSGASALLAWFPASWASKIAPKLLENAPENAQKPQEINLTCPKRSCDETPVEGEKQLLQAVKFVAKNLPGFHLGVDEDFQMAGSFQELINGYTAGLVEPCMMRGLQPLGSNRTTLEVIIPSPEGLTPEKWKETATLCPLDWPSNYSLYYCGI